MTTEQALLDRVMQAMGVKPFPLPTNPPPVVYRTPGLLALFQGHVAAFCVRTSGRYEINVYPLFFTFGEHERDVIMAHELAHAIRYFDGFLHKRERSRRQNLEEHIANHTALVLLGDGHELVEGTHNTTLTRKAEMWYVQYHAVRTAARLRELGWDAHISDWRKVCPPPLTSPSPAL